MFGYVFMVCQLGISWSVVTENPTIGSSGIGVSVVGHHLDVFVLLFVFFVLRSVQTANKPLWGSRYNIVVSVSERAKRANAGPRSVLSTPAHKMCWE